MENQIATTQVERKANWPCCYDTRHMAIGEDTVSSDVANPPPPPPCPWPQHPRVVLSGSHSTVAPPWQVYQMFKLRHVGMLGLQNKEVALSVNWFEAAWWEASELKLSHSLRMQALR